MDGVMGLPALSLVAMVPLLLGALVLALGLLRRCRVRAARGGGPGDRAIFLFDGDHLADRAGQVPAASGLPDAASRGRDAALALLGRHFPDLAARLAAADSADATATLDVSAGGDRLRVERWGGFTRLTLWSMPEPGTGLRIAALEDELALLRDIARNNPVPVWREDATGRVIWANPAYLALADLCLAPGPTPQADGAAPWPLQPIFAPEAGPPADASADASADETPDESPDPAARLVIPGTDRPRHFRIRRLRRDGMTTGFALDITREIMAEDARGALVQTLGRTFADLGTGLAVFDRDRRLTLFNPAFADLTGLAPDRLARRPHLRSLLDQMREAGLVPEPRDWAGWRDRVANLQLRAEAGSHRESWTLPDGRSWRITGRPHPDGALAFFIEDVSDELSLNRHLRRSHEMLQAVLDRLPQALAVFSADGDMLLCNAAYAAMWDVVPEQPVDRPLADEVARWRAGCGASPVWARLDSALADGVWPGESTARLRIAARGEVELRLLPLAGGQLMASFADRAQAQAAALGPAMARARGQAALLESSAGPLPGLGRRAGPGAGVGSRGPQPPETGPAQTPS